MARQDLIQFLRDLVDSVPMRRTEINERAAALLVEVESSMLEISAVAGAMEAEAAAGAGGFACCVKALQNVAARIRHGEPTGPVET